MTAPKTDDRRAAEVFYDGGCPICRREIAAYRSVVSDGGVDWVDVSEDLRRRPAGVSREDLLARFHVRRGDGELVSGAAAFLSVWRAMPRLRRLAALLDRPPFVWIAEQAYRGFLVIRPLWRGRGRARS